MPTVKGTSAAETMPRPVDDSGASASSRVEGAISYVLLGAFASDLDSTGIPLIAFFGGTGADGPMRVFFAPDLHAALKIIPPPSTWWVYDFLSEVRALDFNDPAKTSCFSKDISSMNVGPLRTVTAGSIRTIAETIPSTFTEDFPSLLTNEEPATGDR